VVSAFRVPDITRNMVIRPANGSATVFQTKAAYGSDSEAVIATSSPPFSAFTGRSAGDGT